MARRKNAAALFEVIHADNRFTKRHNSRWSLRAPRLWFGRRSSSDAAAAMPVAEPIDYAPAAPRGPSIFARLAGLIPPLPRVGMSFDPERQLVRFQLTYTGVMVSAFALVVAIALAYLVGRQSSHRPLPALAEQTTEELRNGPAFADVLNVHDEVDPPVAMAVGPAATTPRGGTAPAGAATAVQQPGAATPSSSSSLSASQSAARTSVANALQPKPQQPIVRPSQWTEPKPPVTYMVSDENRTVGLQYVIVQSYPEEERELAEAAKKTLIEHGVLCTIERGLPYAPSWYCVVGITGFARTRDVPEYNAYVARIQQISDQFAGTSKFKKFEPKPFRWREMKAAPAAAKPDASKTPTPKR